MLSIHPHKCQLCGWIERIPGGTRQNDGLETEIKGGLRLRDARGEAGLRGCRAPSEVRGCSRRKPFHSKRRCSAVTRGSSSMIRFSSASQPHLRILILTTRSWNHAWNL